MKKVSYDVRVEPALLEVRANERRDLPNSAIKGNEACGRQRKLILASVSTGIIFYTEPNPWLTRCRQWKRKKKKITHSHPTDRSENLHDTCF